MLPGVCTAVLLMLWSFAVHQGYAPLLPTPWQVVAALGKLFLDGRLLRSTVASLFRLTWGMAGALVIAIPFGLWLASTLTFSQKR